MIIVITLLVVLISNGLGGLSDIEQIRKNFENNKPLAHAPANSVVN